MRDAESYVGIAGAIQSLKKSCGSTDSLEDVDKCYKGFRIRPKERLSHQPYKTPLSGGVSIIFLALKLSDFPSSRYTDEAYQCRAEQPDRCGYWNF